MKPWAALRLVATDLGALFSRGERAKYAFFLLGSLVLQAAFWYLATPGPTVLRLAPQEPVAAFSSVAWSAILLLLIPAVFYRVLIGPLEGAGFRIGDWRFGLGAAVPLALLAAALMYFASSDPTLAATYPWAGTWVGANMAHVAQWLVVYGLYYLAFEGFYRGFVLSVATRATTPEAALWLSVVMATLVHLGKPLAEVMAAAPASVLFALLAVRSRSILYSLLLHLAIGFALDLAVLARSGQLLN